MLRTILSLICGLYFSLSTIAQTFDPYIGNIVSNYNYDTVLTYLNEFEALGVKGIGTPALANAQNWLLDKYASYGYSNVTVQPFTYFGNTTANVIVKKEGCQYPNTYVIVDGHYDTKNGPGTNDNGTGTSIILEMARQLKDVQTKYSILFIHFSGEEDGLIGSQYYVNNTVIPQNLDIKLVFNIDEVGGISGMTNNTIVCERDEGSPLANNAQSAFVTDQLVTCVGLYSNLNAEISFAYASDYMPFEDNGEIITGFYEKNESPYPHTANDVLANMDPVYAHQVGKAATGATLFWAEAYDQTNITVTQCEPYVSPSGNYTWTTTGTYSDTLSTLAGCDSIVNIDLTINSIDVGVNQNLNTLTANDPGANSYQWIDCDNANAPIAGETNNSFTASQTGTYAVVINNNGCTDTSVCTYVIVSGIDELYSSYFDLYPNPAMDNVTLSTSMEHNGLNVRITDMYGKVVLLRELKSEKTLLETRELANGIYVVSVDDGKDNLYRTRLMVNN